mgnify:CR=1 FL=1
MIIISSDNFIVFNILGFSIFTVVYAVYLTYRCSHCLINQLQDGASRQLSYNLETVKDEIVTPWRWSHPETSSAAKLPPSYDPACGDVAH